MRKILTIIGVSFLLISSAECIQVIYPSSPYRTSEETHRLNQHEEQMQMQRQSLEMQRQMLNEYKRNNMRNL